jgi:hypothetical protein
MALMLDSGVDCLQKMLALPGPSRMFGFHASRPDDQAHLAYPRNAHRGPDLDELDLK